MALYFFLLGCGVLAEPEELMVNGGFEQIAAGQPVGWGLTLSGHRPATLLEPGRASAHAGRISSGTPAVWRQEILAPANRDYVASGWFRAQEVTLGEGYLRFYFHVHYQGRPYSEASQIYRDLPAGSYDWTRFALAITPNPNAPIEKIWVTVVGDLATGTLDFDDLSLRPNTVQTGFLASDWERSSEATVLTDLTVAQPAEALSTGANKGRWQTIPYQAGPSQGTLLWAAFEAEAPSVTIPLAAEGWQAVFLGLGDPNGLGSTVLARLTGEPAFQPKTRTVGAIEEVLLEVADLTGRDLELAQRHDPATSAGLAYVKLVPLTPAEIERVQAPRERSAVATIDGFSYFHTAAATTREQLLEETVRYRDSDFGTLILQLGGADMVNYPSRVGEMIGQGLEVYQRAGDRRYAESLAMLAERGINPTQVLIAGGRAAGMKVHVAIRPAAWEYYPPFSTFFTSSFYRAHPAWRTVDRDGTEVVRMSFAVPEVRAHLVEVLREAVGFGADGACLLFNRGVPLVLFEEPFRRLFEAKHGEDPRQVPEGDPRLLDLRAAVLTGFMREVRAMLDEESRRLGRELALSAIVLADENSNRTYGLDVERWVSDGLVQLVMPFLSAGGNLAKGYDLAWFNGFCDPAGVAVKPALVAWQSNDFERFMKDVVGFWDEGAEGVTVWDASGLSTRNDAWSVASRLGHREELRERAELGRPAGVYQRFQSVGGVVVDGRYHPAWGY